MTIVYSEHPREIGSIHLVDDQHVVLGTFPVNLVYHLPHNTWANLKGQHSVVIHFGPQTFHELFVAIGRMELDRAKE